MKMTKKKGRLNMKNTKVITPKILYYGTPVVLLNTLNQDGTTNISPISSSWALGNFIILGVSTSGKAFENLQNHPEYVMNIPDPALWEDVCPCYDWKCYRSS